MDSPQTENGYTRIANELLDALIKYRIPGEQRQCLDVIIRKTYGFNKKRDSIALSQFVEMTGINKPAVVRAIQGLLSKKIIHIIKKDNKPAHIYEFNKHYKQWTPLSKKITLSKKIMSVVKKDNPSLSKKSTTKDNTTKDNTTKDITVVFEKWNALKIIQHRDLAKLKPNIGAFLKKYKLDEIVTAMDNYALVFFGDEYYWTYKWGLKDFLQRGIDRFIPINFKIKDFLKREIKPDLQPQTFSQAERAQRMESSRWLLKEMKNEKTNKQDNSDGVIKTVSELPEP